jgi:hypothetical protein
MSKLKDLVNKGVRLIVVDSDERPPETSAAEREVPPEMFDAPEPPPSAKSTVPADVADFGAVYAAAGIELPLHGYGVDKVAEMLASKRLATMSREVKASAVLAAIEAASVDVKDVLQDAVRRDRALDAFEEAKSREVRELRAGAEARIQAIKDEMDAFLKAKNTEIEELKKAADAAQRALGELQGRKQREEERLFDVVSHFLEGGDNPITRSGPQAPAAKTPSAPPKPPDQA